MSRKVWKFNKFDGGLNSYTDPKDINSNEFAELQDVNISKIGIIKPLGSPETDLRIDSLDADKGLMPGTGLYSFMNNHSFVEQTITSSWSYGPELVSLGGGGSRSLATFGIRSCVWGYTGSTSSHLGFGGGDGIETGQTVTFQLHIRHDGVNVPIMEPLTVLGGTINRTYWTVIGDDPTTTNVFRYNPTEEGGDYDVDWSGMYPFDPDPPRATSTAHQVVELVPPGGNPWDPFGIVDGYINQPPGYKQGWAYWSHYENSYNNNLNNGNLPLDAQYNSGTGMPSGTHDIHSTAWMVGFYRWDGYLEDTKDAEGNIPELNFDPMYTRIYCPDVGTPHVDTFEDANYRKTRLAFLGEVGNAINSYPGTAVLEYKDRFSASLSPGFGHQTLYSATPCTTYNDSPDADLHIHSFWQSDIGGNIGADFGGTDFKPKILSSVHRAGSIGVVGVDPGGNNTFDGLEHRDDHEFVPGSSLITGDCGDMVLTGDTIVTAGTVGTGVHTYQIIIRGHPESGYKFHLIAAAIYDGMPNLHNGGLVIIDYHEAAYETNLDYVNAMVEEINSFSEVTTVSAYSQEFTDDGAGDTYVNPYPEDEHMPARMIIHADNAGDQYQFGVFPQWLTDLDNWAAGVNTEDEHVCAIFKTGVLASWTSEVAGMYQLALSIFSKDMGGWISNFRVIGVDEVNTNYTEVFPWFKFRTTEGSDFFYATGGSDFDMRDSSPIFWNEGGTVRIAETNFTLSKLIQKNIDNNAIVDDAVSHGGAERFVEANPNMWIGYKDLQHHYGGLDGPWDRSAITIPNAGFFINKLDRKWNFSITQDELNSDIPGLCKESFGQTPDESTELGLETYWAFGDRAALKFRFGVETTGNGIDWCGSIKVYACAVYDDNSEGLPGHLFDTSRNVGADDAFGEIEDGKFMSIKLIYLPEAEGHRCFHDPRIVGIRLYYSHDRDLHADLWNLGLLDFEKGFIKALTVETADDTSGNEPIYSWTTCGAASLNLGSNSVEDNVLTVSNGESYDIEYNEMPKTQRFEDINAYSPYVETISAQYKAVCQAGRRTFVGNIRVWNGTYWEYHNDRMVVSPVNSLETFPYPANVLDFDVSDGDEIIALIGLGDKVLQFKQRTLYVLNISTGIASEFYIETTARYRGIEHRNHVCLTDNGVFWYNTRGAWMYDGDEIRDIFVNDEDDKEQQRISYEDWSKFTNKTSLCGFHPESKEVIIVASCNFEQADEPIDADGNPRYLSDQGDCMVYNTNVDAWSIGKKKFYLRNADNDSLSTGLANGEKYRYMSNIINFGPKGDFEYLAESNPGLPPLPPPEENF